MNIADKLSQELKTERRKDGDEGQRRKNRIEKTETEKKKKPFS